MKRVIKLFSILVIILIIGIIISLLMMNNNGYEVAKTKFIAHRGLSSEYYENSEQAFLAAGQSSFFYGIETDIWLTKDGVWLCAHDINPFENLAKNIDEINYSEAKNLPLDTSNSEYGIHQEPIFICSFERYLDICIEYKKLPVIELKYSPSISELENLVNLVSSKISLKKVMFISFKEVNIKNLKNINPQLPTMLLTNKAVIASLLPIYEKQNAGIRSSLVNQKIVQSIQEQGGLINVWTVNNKEEVIKFIEWGVDFITTDFVFDL